MTKEDHPLRILIVSQYFPPEPMRVGDLARGLRERGHEVTVLTSFPSYPYERLYDGYKMKLVQREEYYGVNVIRVPHYPSYSRSRIKRALNYLSFALSGSILGVFLVGRPDRVLVFQNSPFTMTIPAAVVRGLRGGSLFVWVQDLWPDTLESLNIVRNRLALGALRTLVRTVYRRCERILVQSRGFIPAIEAYGIPRDRIEYLPNWAEDVYQVVPVDGEFMRAENLPEGFRVVFAGNVGVAQGLDVLLDAADRLRHIPEIRFVVIGGGSMSREIVEDARRRGLGNVTFKGLQPVEKMPKYFAAADALLVQLKGSPPFARTIPGKLQSYMACGRPILAALAGSGADVVAEAGAGVVCRPDDAAALSEAVLALWRMTKEDRERMGASARRYYEQYFARQIILSRLEEILGT